jgi:hypothetical protein
VDEKNENLQLHVVDYFENNKESFKKAVVDF